MAVSDPCVSRGAPGSSWLAWTARCSGRWSRPPAEAREPDLAQPAPGQHDQQIAQLDQRARLSDAPPQADNPYRQRIKLKLRAEMEKPKAYIQLVMTTESVAAQNIERAQRSSRDQGPNAPTGTTTTPSSRR